MDLKTFNFPNPTIADIAFPTYDTIPELLKEAQERKFNTGYHPYNRLFSKLFFMGGTVKFKSDIDPEYRNRVWAYIRSFMGSYSPSHHDKEAVCSMLLAEICEPELQEK